MTTWAECQTRDSRDRQLLQQEQVIIEATEAIVAAMRLAGVSRTQLAARLGKTKGWVSQLLTGSANMTLRTMADVMTALDAEMRIGFVSQQDSCGEFSPLIDPITWVTPAEMPPYHISVALEPGHVHLQLAGA